MNQETTSGQRGAAADGDGVGAGSQSVWREERLGLILNILAGIAVGTPFLLAAGIVWGVAAWPVTMMFATGGTGLLVGPGVWHAVDTWQLSRRLTKREGHSNVQQA